MIEHNGIKTEVLLPKISAPQQDVSPTIYVR